MNDTPQNPFAFVPANPKGSQPNAENTLRTKAELAAVQGEKPINAFDEFDHVFSILNGLPKPVRDRIMSTLNRIYA